METTEVVSAESSTHAISHPTKRPREGDEEKEDAQNEAKKIKVTVDEKVEVKPDNRVCYVFTKAALVAFDLLPVNKGRARMVHSLIKGYGLLSKLRTIASVPATVAQLEEFHSQKYINFMKKYTPESDTADSSTEEDACDEWGLAYDCSPFKGIFEHVTQVAGASLSAAEQLIRGDAQIAINWIGGRHHAKKDQASGYCYVNDIVLSILSLSNKFERVMYLDIDIHHGDGVEEAFYFSNRVLTLSFHHHAPAFFPGTGALTDIGQAKGKYHAINVPLRAGISDEDYVNIFKIITNEAFLAYKPTVIVMQCGLDCLTGDPIGVFNLTLKGVEDCVRLVKSLGVPLLLLGGGGYHHRNTARGYALLTGVAIGETLPNDLPEHKYFCEYSDNGFQLQIEKRNIENKNDTDYLNLVKAKVLENLRQIIVSHK